MTGMRRNVDEDWREPPNSGVSVIKYVTGTHWTQMAQVADRNRVPMVVGGKLSFGDGQTITQLVEFVKGPLSRLGSETTLQWKVEGDQLVMTQVRNGSATSRQARWKRLDNPTPVKHPLIGTWQRQSFKVESGTWREHRDDMVMLKSITGGHWNWVAFNADTREVTNVFFGEAKLDDTHYREVVRHGSEGLLNKEQVFTWDIEDDVFHQSGKLSTGNELEEKFARVTTAMPKVQPSAAQQRRPNAFGRQRNARAALVSYMQIPEGGEELYLNVERLWKKRHQASKQAGAIRDWVLFKVERVGNEQAPYQYATMTFMGRPSRTEQIRVRYSPDEREIMDKTQEARTLLRTDFWQLGATAMPQRSLKQAGDQVRMGFMKSRDAQAHFALERDVYRKVWRERANLGDIHNWSIWRRRSGNRLNEEEPPFNLVGMISYPKSGAKRGSRYAQLDAARTVFPNETEEQLVAKLGQAKDLRDVFAYETWTIVDHTFDTESPSIPTQTPEVDEARLEREWAKLAGVWRAEHPNGAYRIKRISRGQEILEEYDSDGELRRRLTSEMKIERKHGLNFFTVRDGLPNEYTSIYRVRDGKWYEQLRGIFPGSRIEPDRFLIYQRVE